MFLGNAVGIVDQTRAASELAAHGAPAGLVLTLIMAGRTLQLGAGSGTSARRPVSCTLFPLCARICNEARIHAAC
jgi:hypothetical protein